MKRILFLFLMLILSVNQTFADEKQDFYVAQKAFEDGFYEISLKYFEDFISKYPDSEFLLEAKIYKAKCLMKLKDYFSAKEYLEKLLEGGISNPSVDEIYYLLGKINLEGNNLKEAQNYFLKTIHSKFQTRFDALSYFSLAEIKENYKYYKEALDLYRKALEVAEDKELKETIFIKMLGILYEERGFSELKEMLKEYDGKFPKKTFEDYFLFYRAELNFYYERDYQKAQELFSEVAQITKNTFIKDLSLSRLVDILCKKSEFDKAFSLIGEITNPELKYLELGNFYFNQKNYNESLKFYEKVIKRSKDKRILATALLGKALNLEALGRYKDAVAIFEKIIKDFSDLKELTEEAHYRLGWIYLKISDFKKAIQQFKKVAFHSSDPIIKISADCQIADAYQETGDFEKALELYDKILKDYPDNIYSDYIQFQIGNVFLKMKKPAKAILAFKILEEKFPNSIFSDEALYNEALCYYLSSDFLKAKKTIKRFLENYKENPLRLEALYLLSQIYFQEQDYVKCERVLNKIIKEFPLDRELVQEAWFNKGICMFQRGDSKSSLEYFKKIKDKLPLIQKARILLWLGDYYCNAEEFDLSRRYYTEILKLPVKEYKLQALVNIGYLELEEGNLKKAEEIFYKILKGKENLQKRIQAGIGLLEVYARLQDEKKIVELTNRLLEEAKSSPQLLQRIADALKELGYFSQAIRFYKTFLEQRQDLDAYLALGDCYLEKGVLEEALKAYFKVVYLWPTQKEALFKAYLNIAQIYKRKNNFRRAIDIYKKIQTLGVDYSKIALEKIQEIKEELKRRRQK